MVFLGSIDLRRQVEVEAVKSKVSEVDQARRSRDQQQRESYPPAYYLTLSDDAKRHLGRI